MRHPPCLLAAVLALVCSWGSPAQLRAADPPRYNLVAIVTDDQALWTLGCYGNKEVKTPNMDRLAKEGVRFANAFVVTPVCSPSRTSYMTGRYGIELGITDWIAPEESRIGLPTAVTTWPAVLQKAGYKTALIGKWHLGVQPDQHPTKRGFDHFFGNLGGGWSPKDPTFEVDGKPKAYTGFSVDLMTDETIRWIGENKSQPFAVCVHYREPHIPYGPMPAEDEAVYVNTNFTLPDAPGLDRDQVQRATREYQTAIHAVDRNLGRLLNELDRLKIADRTIVMFTSDHGYNIGHHTIHAKGNGFWIAGGVRGPVRPNMWDTSLRVPLLVRWPGVTKPGAVVSETVANIDTLPTVCGMLEVPMPGNLTQRGKDFAPLLRGETVAGWDNDLYGAYDLHNSSLAYMRMVRTPQWKLVRFLRSNFQNELYDLVNDPGETKNLYNNAKAATARAELQAKLDAWRNKIGDPLKE